MAGTLRPRPSHPNVTNSAYHCAATSSQTTYPEFSTSLQHNESGYNASEYEHGEHRHHHSDTAQRVDHAGMDLQTSPIQQHDFTHDHTARRLPHTQYSPPGAADSALPDQFRMLPPSASKHATWQALYDYAQSHAAAEGYALSINTTAKNRSRIKLACVCYGQPKNTHKLTAETRIRKNRVSYKTGCKMWVEGKKLDDDTWLLRVGEAQHNHPGRPSEGWAAQRKRTWGVVGGRIGVGGVTAQEEQARLGGMNKAATDNDEGDGGQDEEDSGTLHHHQRGGLVWKIVEEEMLRKSDLYGSRDGSVDRTVEVLRVRLPGIHIFKRDVYNIRAAVKRAWKAAEEQGQDSEGEGAEDGAREDKVPEDDGDDREEQEGKPNSTMPPQYHQHSLPSQTQTRDFAYDPPTNQPRRPSSTMSTTQVLSASSAEVEQLRREVVQLKSLLVNKTKEATEKDIVIASLRSQLEYMNMAMLR